MNRKLRSSGGFTLTEMLAAIVILLLTVTALGAGISASVRVYQQSVTLSEAGTLLSTLTEAVSDELRFAENIIVETDASGARHLTFTSVNYGVDASFSNGDDGRIKISGADLVGEMAYSSLHTAAEIDYSAGSFSVLLSITDPKQDNFTCRRAEFSIVPLNP